MFKLFNKWSPFQISRRSLTKNYPHTADAVIIGGGVISLSTAYHLSKLGVKRIVILEKNKLTSGTTWHTAGLIWRLRPSDTDIQLLNRTRDLLRDELLRHPSVEDTGWINNGGLFLAHSKERLNEYQRLFGLSKVFDVNARMVDKADIKEILGSLIDGEQTNLIGGLYSPGDGCVDPSIYCTALRKAAGKSLSVFEESEVVAIRTKPKLFGHTKKVSVVEVFDTQNHQTHEINTDVIVSASGIWAPRVAKLAGIEHLPQDSMEHAYVITDTVPGNLVDPSKTPNIRDHDLSIYCRVTGNSFQIGGYEADPAFLPMEVNSLGPFTLFDLDWNKFGIHLENAFKLMPSLRNLGVKSIICGPESFTPDHKPLLGEDPVVRGFYHATGFNSLGMNLSGGCGQEIANWIVKGKPDLDMFAYDIRRFNPVLSKSVNWIKDRCVESYAKNYSIVYPYDEALEGRNETFRDPLYEILLEKGCVYQERQGKERPGYFLSEKITDYAEALNLDYSFKWQRNSKQWQAIEQECRSCRNSVVIFNSSYMGKVRISGPGAGKAVEWIATSDFSSKKPGQTVYTCLLNADGGVEADITVSKISETDFYLNTPGFAANYVLEHIRSVLGNMQDVCIVDQTNDFGILSVQGRHSRLIIEQALNLSLEELPFSSHKEFPVNTADSHSEKIRIIRITFVGELGYELHIPRNQLVEIYNRLMSTGKATNAGWRAIDCLSAEKGYRHWHHDVRSDDTPFEAKIGFTVDKNKLACDEFFGAAQLKQRKKSQTKNLICLTVDADADEMMWGLEPILHDGKAIGYVRRASFAFELNKAIGYGYVDKKFSKLNQVMLWMRGKQVRANVHQRSPFDQQNSRVKGIY